MLSDVLESIAPLPGFEIWNLTTEAGSSPGDIQTTRYTNESNSVDDAMIQDTWTKLRPWLDQDVSDNITGTVSYILKQFTSYLECFRI